MDFDWTGLEELRAAYLDGTAGEADYWSSDTLLASYDATFARRIAWKWHWVYRELERVGWTPPPGPVLDWGCGTGVAGREFFKHYRDAGLTALYLRDRSPRAERWAARAAREEFPEREIKVGLPEEPFTLVLSHVVTELDERALGALIELAGKAAAVLWVEPGSSAASRQVVRAREALREQFHVVAPCTHRAQCGLLAPGRENDWCHFFAPPPNDVYTDSDWVMFGRVMGIDLRSLPLSFLALDRRPVSSSPPERVRVVGRHRLYKAHALLDGCDASGVNERRFTKRTDPVFFRAMNKFRVATLQDWKVQGREITEISDVPLPEETAEASAETASAAPDEALE